MAHSRSQRKQDDDARMRLAIQKERDRPLQERFKRDAKFAVAAWNVRVIRGLPLTFFPTIAAAVKAKRPFLACVCPGCKVRGSVDLRAYGRRAMVTVDTLIPALRCQRCVPNAPHVHVMGLRKRSPESEFR